MCASVLLVVCASALLVVCASALLVVCDFALLVVLQCICKVCVSFPLVVVYASALQFHVCLCISSYAFLQSSLFVYLWVIALVVLYPESAK